MEPPSCTRRIVRDGACTISSQRGAQFLIIVELRSGRHRDVASKRLVMDADIYIATVSLDTDGQSSG